MNKTITRYWRMINLLFFGMALITPWLSLELDAYTTPLSSTPGWSFVLEVWRGVLSDLVERGLDLAMWPFWLLSLSYGLVLVYIIFSIFFLAKGVRSPGNKIVSFMLLGAAAVMLFPVLIGARSMWGYWLLNLALLSSAFLEWKEANSPDK